MKKEQIEKILKAKFDAKIVEDYIASFEEGFEESAYENMTEEELIEDFRIFYEYR